MTISAIARAGPLLALLFAAAPANGAVTRVKPCSWRSRCTFASAAANRGSGAYAARSCERCS